MRALTIEPGRADSARLEQVEEPSENDGAILVRTLAIGICGTDAELIAGHDGMAPGDERRLILGHESIGIVERAPEDCGLAPGDYVAGIVRRPDPVPCIPCAIGEWDMCRNGLYTECGIKGRHGFASERFRIEPDFAVKVSPSLGFLGVLLEPASVLAKAWDHIRRIGGRAAWAPDRVLITGAGPVGLLAALMGVQQGYEVHVFDRNTSGSKPELVRTLGAFYHTDLATIGFAPDIVLECTGATSVVLKVMTLSAPSGIVCLTGAPARERIVSLDLGQFSREMVTENSVIFGSVNANRRHFELAADALARADKDWLARLISRRVPVDDWRAALGRRAGEVKVVLEFDAG
ncbi:MAG: alcohol dehydrogenase catalytic protein [Rhodospirillales bacterium]|nr:alcohol dehydrogenase catalytic protein [Rhodospirillales bacterium]